MNRMNAPALIDEQVDNAVLTLTLGGGVAHPLSLGMINALHDAITRAAENDLVRAIVIHGPGHIFCAGHDLKEIARHRDDADDGRAFVTALFEACGAMMLDVTLSAKPTIAMVGGIATAAGLQLVAACDLAFATPAATFCLPGVNNGGFCTTPAVAVSRAIGRKQVMEMALTGTPYDADWALRAGLINRIVPDQDLAGTVQDFAAGIARFGHPAIGIGKRTLHEQRDMPLAEAYAHATPIMVDHFMDPARLALEREKARHG